MSLVQIIPYSAHHISSVMTHWIPGTQPSSDPSLYASSLTHPSEQRTLSKTCHSNFFTRRLLNLRELQ